MQKKYVLLKYWQHQYYCRDKGIILNRDNADEICTAQNIYVKSSQGDKMIIFNPKMKKNICHKNIQESNTCGDKVEVALNVLNADKTCAAENS